MYEKHATWQDTLSKSLLNLCALEDRERAAAAARWWTACASGPWYACASFDNTDGKGFAEAYPPEKEIALDKTYPGMKNTQAGWRRMDAFVDGEMQNLLPHFKQTEWAIAYLYRKVTAQKATQLTCYFGSDDGLVMWLNGEKLLSSDVPRGLSPDQEKATLSFKAGDNDLLLKIVNRTGGWGFYFSTKPGGGRPEEKPDARAAGGDLWSRLRQDFPGDERPVADDLRDQ